MKWIHELSRTEIPKRVWLRQPITNCILLEFDESLHSGKKKNNILASSPPKNPYIKAESKCHFSMKKQKLWFFSVDWYYTFKLKLLQKVWQRSNHLFRVAQRFSRFYHQQSCAWTGSILRFDDLFPKRIHKFQIKIWYLFNSYANECFESNAND